MNQTQYNIVKSITSFPFMDTRKFARLIKVDHSVVLRVQASNNFDQFKDNDVEFGDMMADLFKGGKS